MVIPSEEYDRLKKVGDELPPLPKRLPGGNFPLIEASRIGIARQIIRLRKSVGLSQAELARRAGVRIETLNRLERARHTPDVSTIDKISKALTNAGAK